jgi:hypothetical protein
VYKDMEGGFFAIDGDDGKTYDPINLPDSFKINGLKVTSGAFTWLETSFKLKIS